MMKMIFLAMALFVTTYANAQYTKFDSNKAAAEQQAEKQQAEKKQAAKKQTAAVQIDPKYGVGSCPVVDGKIMWSTTISCPGLTAQQIYDRALKFLAPYCKEKDKDENSQVALVNPTTHEIGARIGEYVVFTKAALTLDRAMLHYTLRINCEDGRCNVSMASMSYKYEENSFPAEEMLLDKNALNKTQTKFLKGGYKKFRTKTIDAKDFLFRRLADAINQK